MKTLTNLLIKQTEEANSWTNKLIHDIDSDQWFITPEVIESNIAWQLGHLTLSQYYYLVVLIKGPQKELGEKINLKKYSSLFAKGQKIEGLSSEIKAQELKDNWNLITESSITLLHSLNDTVFNDEITKLPKAHPFIKTKLDSVSWNIKHNMWHCGQIGILNRILDKPFDFGL